MAKSENNPISQAESVHVASSEIELAAVDDVKQAVELVLERPLKRGTTFHGSPVLRWRYSTDPKKADSRITAAGLSGQCQDFSYALSIGLMLDGTFDSRLLNTREHTHLRVPRNGVEVRVDPTIGQFVLGHSHVFVGTVGQLKDLILNKTRGDGPYSLSPLLGGSRPRILRRVWGTETARIKPTPTA